MCFTSSFALFFQNYKQLLRKSTKIGRRRRGGANNPANNAQQPSAAAGSEYVTGPGASVGVRTRNAANNRSTANSADNGGPDKSNQNSNDSTANNIVDQDNSNRSTPNFKQDIKDEKDDE